MRIPDIESCWFWPGTPGPLGYLRTGVGGYSMYVHRVMYEIAGGSVPEGYEVHHTCQNRHCVNPFHMVAMTHAEHCAQHAQEREVQRQTISY